MCLEFMKSRSPDSIITEIIRISSDGHKVIMTSYQKTVTSYLKTVISYQKTMTSQHADSCLLHAEVILELTRIACFLSL